MNRSLLQFLACPYDHDIVQARGIGLACQHGHQFYVEDGIPILTDAVRREAVPRNMKPCPLEEGSRFVDAFVSDWIVNTNGNLYRRVRGRLKRYPTPAGPGGNGRGETIVDLGCSWGRWSIAAGRAGFVPIGVDVHIDALHAAGRVSEQLGVQAHFVCAEVGYLPFKSGSIDVVFSYSVFQHLERTKVLEAFGEIVRILKPGGMCLVQLPNRFGMYSMLQQAKRCFREARQDTFEMRYWSRAGITDMVHKAGLVGLRLRADGFFSQNPQPTDLDLLSPMGKCVVSVSHAGCKAAGVFPLLMRMADSLWIEARKYERREAKT